MDRFNVENNTYRGTLKENSPYEIFGMTEHVVSVVIPEGEASEVNIDFSYLPSAFSVFDSRNAVCVTKTIKKTGVVLVSGRFASISWRGPGSDKILVYYSGYPK